MTVYMVQNNDGIMMAICLTKRKANDIAVKVGQHRWHEAWRVVPVEVDKLYDPTMMYGSESYQKMLRKLEERSEERSGES